MANVPISNLTTTWNNVSTTFNGIKLNVTDTASAADSLLMDLQVGGVSRFGIQKDGKFGLPVIGASALSISYAGHSHLGIYRLTESNPRAIIGTVGLFTHATGSFGFSNTDANATGTPDVTLFRDAANILAQRNGVNAQTFRLYNTFTDASNYERGFVRWSSNVFEVGHESAGTGSTGRVNRYYLGPGSTNTYLTRAPSSQHAQFFWNGTLAATVGQAVSSSVQPSSYGLLLGTSSDYSVGVISGFAGGVSIHIAPSAMFNSNRDGASLNLTGGTASTVGNWNGGNIVVRGGTANGTGKVGNIIMDTLPTTNPAVAGALWNNAGVLSVSAG